MKLIDSLLNSLSLSEEDKKLIKKVFFISMAVCIVIIAAAWIIQRVSIKKLDLTDTADGSSEADVSVLYSKKSNDLLPIDIEAHKYAAEQNKNDMNFNKTINHLLRVLSVERNNRKIKFDLAIAYLKAGIYGKADDTFRELADEDISDSLTDPIMSRYGLTLFFSGKIDESIAQLEKTLDKFPSSKEAYCYLGQIEAAQNLASEKAEEYLKKSLQLDPHYAEAWYQLARYNMGKPHAGEDDYNSARKCLQKQLEIEPLNPKAHSRLGMVYYYLQKPHLAKKSYKTALTLNENDYNTHYNLGELYYTLFNDPKKALSEFKKTVSIKNDHAEANYKIGLIALENDQYKEAIRFFREAHKYAPQNIRVLLQLGVTYEKMEMKKEAVSVYQSILDLDKLNDVALQKLKLLRSRE